RLMDRTLRSPPTTARTAPPAASPVTSVAASWSLMRCAAASILSRFFSRPAMAPIVLKSTIAIDSLRAGLAAFHVVGAEAVHRAAADHDLGDDAEIRILLGHIEAVDTRLALLADGILVVEFGLDLVERLAEQAATVDIPLDALHRVEIAAALRLAHVQKRGADAEQYHNQDADSNETSLALLRHQELLGCYCGRRS